MIENSKLLDVWTKDLIAEKLAFYNSKRDLVRELVTVSNLADTEKYKVELEVLAMNTDNPYEKMLEVLSDRGYHYDREEFLRRKGNTYQYSTNYKDLELYSVFNGHIDNKRIEAYSLVEFYFKRYDSITNYNKIRKLTSDAIERLAEKEAIVYVDSLINRVEKRFGNILSVRDSDISNIENVVFECEKGTCYLERISAGGHNVQVLHTRILVKELR